MEIAKPEQTPVNDSGTAAETGTRLTRECSGNVRDWQPIETAPRDGTRVLVADTDVWMAVARNWPCNGGRWIEDAASGMTLNPPTHWMPLPEPPK